MHVYTCPVQPLSWNRIGGVMVSIPAASAADLGFEPRFDKTKNYIIGICRFFAKHAS
jgi:hypothetical protein